MTEAQNILVISSYGFPDNHATANRIKTFKIFFEKNGYNTTIIAPLGKIVEIDNSTNSHIKNIDYKLSENVKNNLMFRLLKEIKLLWLISIETFKSPSNIILISIPSPLLLLLPILFFNRKFIIDIRDVVWDYFGNKIKFKIIIFFMKFLFSRSQKNTIFYSVTNNTQYKKVIELINKKCIKVLNGIELEKFNKLKKLNFKPRKRITMTYIGNVGIAQELSIMVKIAEKFPNLNFRIIGTGADIKNLRNKIEQIKIKNISLLGELEWSDIETEYSKSDILYAQIGVNFKSAVPSKIFEYITVGKKILLGLPNGEAKNIFKNFNGVEIHQSGDIDECEKKLNKILKNNIHDNTENLINIKKNYIREFQFSDFQTELNKWFQKLNKKN